MHRSLLGFRKFGMLNPVHERAERRIAPRQTMTTNLFDQSLSAHLELFSRVQTLRPDIEAAAERMGDALRTGGKVLIAGNGGSAADAQHFAAELVGRFQANRRALACVALTTDSSNLTAVGNDFGFDKVFSRQVEALARPGDIFVGISTSGNSANILEAVREAQAQGITSIALLGRDGGSLAAAADMSVIVPHNVTARIQEAHIFILHHWADVLERSLA